MEIKTRYAKIKHWHYSGSSAIPRCNTLSKCNHWHHPRLKDVSTWCPSISKAPRQMVRPQSRTAEHGDAHLRERQLHGAEPLGWQRPTAITQPDQPRAADTYSKVPHNFNVSLKADSKSATASSTPENGTAEELNVIPRTIFPSERNAQRILPSAPTHRPTVSFLEKSKGIREKKYMQNQPWFNWSWSRFPPCSPVYV